MLLLRIAVIIAALLVASGVVAYIFTGDKRHLQQAWRLTRYTLGLVLLFLLVFFLERLIPIVI